MSNSSAPVLRGFLRQTPLAEFLIQAYDSQLDGTLLLQTSNREKSAIFFVRGSPAKARPAKDSLSFGRVVVDLGFLSASDATAAEKRALSEKRFLAELLREEKKLDDTEIYVALRDQLVRQVFQLCHLEDTTGFGFFRANYLADWASPGDWRAKPLPLFWRALVDHLPETRRDAWLERLGATELRIRASAPISRYAMSQEEKSIVDLLQAKPSTLAFLSESGVGEAALVRRVVCALLLSRQVETGSELSPLGLNEPAETPGSLAPPATRVARARITAPQAVDLPGDLEGGPPSGGRRSRTESRAAGVPSVRGRTVSLRPSTKAPIEKMRAIIEEYQARKPQTHYEVLGIDKSANAAGVRAAFFQLAKVWHPDRLPADLVDLKAIVSKAFAAMSEAHQTLSVEQKRAQYDEALSEAPEDEQAQVAVVLEAAQSFQRAEVFMKKKDFDAAMKEAKKAYEGDPTQADYTALYGWLQGMNRSTDFDELIALLDGALESNGDNVRALWYRGQLLKKAGHKLRAIKDFKKIVELKPNHVDAQRELRVHAMRRRTDPEAAETKGFFGRFKKKD